MTAPADVAIVGAGPVGLLTAVLLAGAGIDVVVRERRDSPAGIPRAIGIHPPGLAALDLARVGDAVRDAAAPIRGGVALCRGRVLGRVRFPDPVLSLPQHRTEALLEARLAALAPSALRRSRAVARLREAGDRVELELDDGDTIAARYVVAADGVRSTARRDLALGFAPRRGLADYVMADDVASEHSDAEAAIHLEPAGVVESFPMPGGVRRWVIRVPRDAAPAGRDAFSALLRERLGVRIPPRRLTEPSRFTARQHVSAGFARGRVALAGDAAHEISPIGGQGMNLGWADAVELAATILRALEAGAPAAPFAAYGRRRRRAAERAARRAAFNMAMGAPASGLSHVARDAAARLLAAPPARAALARVFTMHGL